MPLNYAYLTLLLYLPSLLCLLIFFYVYTVPCAYTPPVSTCTELLCLVILPSVLPSHLPTQCYVYVLNLYYSLLCLPCLLWPVMVNHVVSIAYLLVSYSLPYYAYPVSSAYLVFYMYISLLCLLILSSVLSSLPYLPSQQCSLCIYLPSFYNAPCAYT